MWHERSNFLCCEDDRLVYLKSKRDQSSTDVVWGVTPAKSDEVTNHYNLMQKKMQKIVN